MVKLVQMTEVAGRDFSGNLVTSEIYVNIDCLVAVRPSEGNKSVLVMPGVAPIIVAGAPDEIIARAHAIQTRLSPLIAERIQTKASTSLRSAPPSRLVRDS